MFSNYLEIYQRKLFPVVYCVGYRVTVYFFIGCQLIRQDYKSNAQQMQSSVPKSPQALDTIVFRFIHFCIKLTSIFRMVKPHDKYLQ